MIFAAQLSERSGDKLVQLLVGCVLFGLRCFQRLEVRSRRVVRRQEVFMQVNAVWSHFVPRNTGYKFSGAGRVPI